MKSDDYESKCKYCGAKPFPPGPQHDTSCQRWRVSLDLDSKEAYEYKCKHCGVKPFVEGSHHKSDCPRYKSSLSFTISLSPGTKPTAPPWYYDKDDPRYPLRKPKLPLFGGEHPLSIPQPKYPRLGGEHPLDERWG